jgi:hypothetical protein
MRIIWERVEDAGLVGCDAMSVCRGLWFQQSKAFTKSVQDTVLAISLNEGETV